MDGMDQVSVMLHRDVAIEIDWPGTVLGSHSSGRRPQMSLRAQVLGIGHFPCTLLLRTLYLRPISSSHRKPEQSHSSLDASLELLLPATVRWRSQSSHAVSWTLNSPAQGRYIQQQAERSGKSERPVEPTTANRWLFSRGTRQIPIRVAHEQSDGCCYILYIGS